METIDQVCFAKTDAGRAEIHDRTNNLHRPARNLLLIVDQSRPAVNWVGLVNGAKLDDLVLLKSRGLIEPIGFLDPGSLSAESLAEALNGLGYDQLYGLLTSQAKDRLGLFRGFRFVLEVERCTCVEELRALAERFIAMIETHQGADPARKMRRALGMTR